MEKQHSENLAAAQRASWAADRRGRRVATAVGTVRAVVRDHPDALAEIVAAAASAAVDARKAAS